MTRLHTRLRAVAPRERGATAVEYGLLVALIAAAVVVIVSTLGTSVFDLYSIKWW